MNNHWERKIFDINRSIRSTMPSNPTMHNFMMSSNASANGDHLMKDIEKPYFMIQPKHSSENFRKEPYVDIVNAPKDAHGPHLLPLARIKKVMKSNEEVKMISAETPMIFSKACELLIMELSLRAWIHTTQNKRRTVQRCDVAKAIREDKNLEFLQDTVPMEFEQVIIDETRVQDPFLKVDTTLPPVVYKDQGQMSHHRASTSSRFDYSMTMQNLNIAVFNPDQEMEMTQHHHFRDFKFPGFEKQS